MGTSNSRMTDNIRKSEAVFSDHNINFTSTDSVFNVITKKVLDPNLTKISLIVKLLVRRYITISFGEVSVWEFGEVI